MEHYKKKKLCVFNMHMYMYIYLTVHDGGVVIAGIVILFCLPISLALIYEPIVDLLQFKPTLFC